MDRRDPGLGRLQGHPGEVTVIRQVVEPLQHVGQGRKGVGRVLPDRLGEQRPPRHIPAEQQLHLGDRDRPAPLGELRGHLRVQPREPGRRQQREGAVQPLLAQQETDHRAGGLGQPLQRRSGRAPHQRTDADEQVRPLPGRQSVDQGPEQIEARLGGEHRLPCARLRLGREARHPGPTGQLPDPVGRRDQCAQLDRAHQGGVRPPHVVLPGSGHQILQVPGWRGKLHAGDPAGRLRHNRSWPEPGSGRTLR